MLRDSIAIAWVVFPQSPYPAGKEAAMRKYTKRETFAPLGPKECWHPYGLQSLQPEKFASVVNSILQGKNRLLPTPKTAR